MAAIESIRAYTFKSRTIQKGWRDAGLYPLDIKRVKNNIQRDFADWDADCQDTGSSSSDSSSNATIDGTPPPPELNTPLTIRTLKRNIDFCLENEKLSENVKRTLFGAYNISVAGDQAIGELRTMTSIAQSRRSRQQRTRTILKSSMGVIYSHSARKMVQNKLTAELSQLKFEYSKMKGIPIMKKKRHFQAYQPVHEQLQRVWASMRAAGLLAYENQYKNWRG